MMLRLAGVRRTVTPPIGWDAIGLHAVTVGAIALIAVLADSPAVTLLLGGALSLCVYLRLALVEARRVPFGLTPLSFYFLWYAVGLGVAAMYYGWVVTDGQSIRFAAASVAPSELARGYVLYLVGSIALHVGMQVCRPPTRPHQLAQPSGLWSLFSLMVLWLVGIGGSWNPSVISALGSLGPLISWAPLAATISLALTPRTYFRLSTSAYYLALAVATIGVVIGNVPTGSKAYLSLSLLPVAWHVLLIPKLRWWIPTIAVAFAALYLGIVEPTINYARITASRDGERAVTPARALDAFTTIRRGEAPELTTTPLSDRVGAFMQRIFDPTPVGFLVADVDTNGLQWGDEMAYASYVFIPRFIWPDKPPVTRGNWFLVYVQGQDSTGTALGMTATGEWYWNFGVAGVLGGMFLIGCLLGQLWRVAGADPRRRPLHMLLYVVTIMATINMAEAVPVLSSAIATLIAFGLCFAVLPHLPRVVTQRRASATT